MHGYIFSILSPEKKLFLGDRVNKTQDNAHEVGVSTRVNPGTSIIFSLIYGKKDSSWVGKVS